MALPIDPCKYVPSIAGLVPTDEGDLHLCSRICSDAKALCIITNRKPVRVWAFRAEIVVLYVRRSMWDSLPVKPSEQRVEQTAVKKQRYNVICSLCHRTARPCGEEEEGNVPSWLLSVSSGLAGRP